MLEKGEWLQGLFLLYLGFYHDRLFYHGCVPVSGRTCWWKRMWNDQMVILLEHFAQLDLYQRFAALESELGSCEWLRRKERVKSFQNPPLLLS